MNDNNVVECTSINWLDALKGSMDYTVLSVEYNQLRSILIITINYYE